MVRVICGMTMIAYVFWIAINLVVFMPMAGGTFANAKVDYSFFAAVLFVSLISTVLNFMSQRISEWLGGAVALALFGYWVAITHGSDEPLWTDFTWFVCPAIAFAAAAIIGLHVAKSDIAREIT